MLSSDISLGNALYWYQKKIGAYDQQSWEKSIEERVLKGFSHAVPKKVARIKTELIDLDLIRGSAFTKAKPQQGCLATIYLGIVRVIFFPFYLKWWTNQTNSWICWLLLALYSLHISAIYVYFNRVSSDQFNDVPVSEVLSPVVMFFILGVMQSQIASSHLSKTDICCQHTRHRNSSCTSPPTSSSARNTFTHLNANVQKSSEVRWKQNRAELNSMVEEEKNILKSNTKVEPLVVEPPKKKASDEESGLDPTDFPETRRSHSVSLKKRRNVLQDISLELQNESDNSSVNSHQTKPTGSITHDANYATDTDPEHDAGDISSIEDCSPYSTVNSGVDTQWKEYAGLVAKKIRFSQNRENLCHDVKLLNEKASLNSIKKSSKKTSSHRINSQSSRSKNESSRHEKPCYSSGDSEASFSPTVGKALTSDLDWPLINSDGSSEDEEGDVVDDASAPNANTTEFFTFSEQHRFVDDLPPSILNLVEENYQSVGPKSEKSCNDKGRRLLSVSCAIWQQNECQKVDLSVLDISSAVIRKVESKKYSHEYFYLGVLFSVILAIIPAVFRHQRSVDARNPSSSQDGGGNQPFPQMLNVTSVESVDLIKYLTTNGNIISDFPFNLHLAHLYVVTSSLCLRFCLSLAFFFLLCVAERTFKERFLYAKYFCHLTSARRARGSELPHFRLNKVRNIKTWLSVRSYLKKHGPQRSVNVIVSTSFIVAVCILTFLCIQLLRETEICAEKLYCWEMVFWNLSIGIYILRLIILGSKMNKKYRSNLSVLITEQINLYLQMEQKPHKKDVLNLANNVLKLAASLLKQLEVPFKISGFSANPYLYNITKVIVLSAFSAVMTEMLGFKLKLYKIKLPG